MPGSAEARVAVKAARIRTAFVQLHVLRGACGTLVTFLGAQLTRTLTVDETGKLSPGVIFNTSMRKPYRRAA